MTAKRWTQTCPICQRQHDEPVGVNRPTCGSPSCIREARSKGLPFQVSYEEGYTPPAKKERKPRKPRTKK